MKKQYRIEVDCPVCAQKMEDCVTKIDGVETCRVNFMTQKMSVEAPREKQADIISQAQRLLKKVDDDIVIYC